MARAAQGEGGNQPPPLTDTSDAGLRRAIELDLVATRLYNTDLPLEAHDEPDASWAIPPYRDLMRSAVVRAYFDPKTADRRIEEIVRAFEARGNPVGWWLAPFHEPGDLGARLVRYGFVHYGVSAGMALDLAELDRLADGPGPPVEHFTIEHVHDAATAREYVGVVQQDRPEGGPPYSAASVDASVELIAGRVTRHPIPTYFLGRLDGRAVATSRLSLAGGAAGVYSVVTAPEARGRGIGRAMTLEVLRIGREAGYRIATLQSSPMGHRIYQRLGFRDVFGYEIFVRMAPMAPDQAPA
jgi:GNAT superfamily N-acetyltransferase